MSLLHDLPDIKIIITTRPSGIVALKESLREYNPTDPISIERLSKDESIELANTILDKTKQKYAESIYYAANGNTLVIVIAADLLQRGDLDGSLLTDKKFREKVLDRLLDELGNIPSRGIDLKVLLATIAGLSPLESQAIELVRNKFGTTQHNLESVFDDLQSHGFIVRIGNRYRIIPDILSDYILFKHSVNSSNKPTDFINKLLDNYGGQYLNNILVNVSELEHDIGIDLAGYVWETINQKTVNCNLQELYSILKTIEPVSYYAPEKVYEIVSKLFRGEIKIKEEAKYYNLIYGIKKIRHLIINILAKLGYRPKYARKAYLSDNLRYGIEDIIRLITCKRRSKSVPPGGTKMYHRISI